MASVLPLSQRLPGQLKRPQELQSWACVGGRVEYNDSGLRYFYIPRTDVERADIDLSANSQTPAPVREPFLDGLLKPIIHYEKECKQKLKAQIVCYRDLLVSVLSRSQLHADPMATQPEISAMVVKFQGQIFICESDFKSVRDPISRRFAEVVTLPKPWGECSRDEIEQRYSLKPSEHPVAHESLVKSGVGGVEMVLGAQIGCARRVRQGPHDQSEYMDLRASPEISNQHDQLKFERKLMHAWIDGHFGGVPSVSYGFYTPQRKLCAVETYLTSQLPSMVRSSKVLQHKWSGKDIVAFCNVFVHWLVDRTEEGKTYHLKGASKSNDLRLEPAACEHGRKVAFLLNEFVDHRSNWTV